MEAILNQKDKKLLEELDLNARRSNAQIGKKIQVSRDAIAYRIKNLEKKHIIKGYYTLLDISKLGYVTYKIMLTFQNTTSEIEQEIIDYLKKSAHVGWLVSCDGYYSLMAVTWVSNAIVFDKFFTSFLKKYSKFLKHRDTIVITENHSCRRAYLFDKPSDETEDTFYGGEPTKKTHSREIELIKLLANNSRIPLYEIAHNLRITAEAVSHRIKQLKKKNVIQAFRPIIDTSLLGYEYYNVLFRLRSFDNIKKMFSYFKSQPNIIYFVKYLGSHDIGMDLEVKNAEKLRKILKEIKDKFSRDIESYNSILIYKEHKLSYYPESE